MKATSFRVGVSPLSWVNEVLEDLGAGTAPDQCLREARSAGFSGVELSRIFPKDTVELKDLLDQHELALVSGWHSGFLAERSADEEFLAVQSHAALLRDCGAQVMVYGECAHMADSALDVPLSKRLKLGQEDFKAYGERLTEFADRLAEDFGLALAYHHHLMMVAETFEEVAAVMDHSGLSVGLLMDTGHAFAGGFNYAKLIDSYADRINHIHLKDVRADTMARVRNDELSFNEGVRAGMFTVPGDGAVDFTPMAKFLRSSGYSGWLVVEAEQDPSIAAPFETVKRARDYLLGLGI
ncbi:myo-inosose-2 dehydratase [Roseinatronobacter alkalisoli]|uniref:Myo-inosose-2 dehydratase n=1 Tax=Roseinatronobacter alkalisoli TaxID=3028235 RepID=A0ABT5TET1_9RHOB|nr:myo-inosose-2 dehydratase [Roseinatronobacter sp. HJB301]MDD7973613.1 myo-inosose-2 dehydratase [Roseinatronobacter sp. HJB301]